MRRAFLGASAAFAIAGCSLLVDTSDLAKNTPDAGSIPTNEAGPNPPPAVIVDAGSDADANIPTPACPPNSIICDDFELGTKKWDTHTQNSGSIDIVTMHPHSPTHSFRSTSLHYVPDASTGTDNQGELRVMFPSPKKTGLLVFHAWIYIPERLQSETGIVKYRTVNATDDMNLKFDTSASFKVDSDLVGEGPELSGSDPAPLGRWTCVEWEAMLGTPGHQTLIVDGKKVIDKDENNAPPTGYGAVGIGFLGNGPTKDMQIFFDDVVVGDTPIACPTL